MRTHTPPIDARTATRALLPCMTALVLSACSPRDLDIKAATAATPPIHTVTVTATDYAFDAPVQVPTGMTTMILVNKGHELHHVQLFHLANGKTISDLAASMKQPGPPPSWMEAAGGPNAAVPGSTTEATFMLAPGNYVMLCLIPGPDHVPHVAKGMLRPLVVTGAQNVAMVTPRSDLTLELTDYAFTFSAPVTAGSHTLRIDNQGKLDHETVLIRLAPGKSAKDFATWTDNQQGPPPAEVLGGLAAIVSGSQGYVTFDFTAGRYALVCFVPDAHDGKPHVEHGMMKEFTI